MRRLRADSPPRPRSQGNADRTGYREAAFQPADSKGLVAAHTQPSPADLERILDGIASCIS